ncbi:TetR/AcrR family transcriptional regulator [Methylobacterium isbiliense]|jgi:AcrR family transcriptional regulator|uniref:Fatty acid metabolism regulator protein n=1 Tax=Methylobacterium isbiliense TaxID=315478 RepID=A0ABQ4SEB2_9HYPH|nr:TetR/AcrR family transcriptional regulator [Methylobacterium isbiliense]MDN3622414.1 TetR/AcrR family transcriptional regulator [Methylobacterium isbiliense]GJE01556.1 Fatty acid metabolism regulator protein [Methylobacterium isbiliense]
MARIAGSSGPRTEEAIRRAGLQLLYTHGYAAMSLRQLAAEVGIQQGSLYNYFRNKQEFLFDLIRTHMQDLHAALDAALLREGSAAERLQRFVEFHVAYHIERPQQVFICYSELRSLEPDNLEVIVAMRRDYERKLGAILDLGRETGEFQLADTRMGTLAILAMLSGICNWYRPDGRLSTDAVQAIFTGMVLALARGEGEAAVQAPPAPLTRLAARLR